MRATDQIQSVQEDIVQRLFPRAATNFLAKLPELQHLPYSTISRLGCQAVTPEDAGRLLEEALGHTALATTAVRELELLHLMLLDQEHKCLVGKRAAVYSMTDAYQHRDAHHPRTLDHFLTRGLEVIFTQGDKRRAQAIAAAVPRRLPLIERLKAERLLCVNGFARSRVLHLIHDLIDHMWLFNHLRCHQLFNRYQDFLASIDLGPDAFLYSRQAELVSTIGFGARRWPLTRQHDLEPLVLTDQDIDDLLTQATDARVRDARQTYRQMQPGEQAWARYVIENMAIQIADERRRWGTVKQCDATTGKTRPMPLLEPLYVAFLIDGTHLLQTHGRGFAAIQVHTAAHVDTFLQDALHSMDQSTTARVTLGDISHDSMKRLAETDVAWLQDHPYFSTAYTSLNDS